MAVVQLRYAWLFPCLNIWEHGLCGQGAVYAGSPNRAPRLQKVSESVENRGICFICAFVVQTITNLSAP